MYFTKKIKAALKIVLSFILLIPLQLLILSNQVYSSSESINNHEIILQQIKRDFKNIISSATFISMAIIILAIFVFKRKKFFVALPLSFFSLNMGVFIISKTIILKSIIYNNKIFWYYISYNSEYLIPVLFFMAVKLMFKDKGKKIINVLCIFFLLFAIFSIFADIFAILPLHKTNNAFLIFLAVALIILGALISISVIHGNSYHKILLFSFIALLLAGICDAAAWLSNTRLVFLNVSSIGTLVFLLTLFFIMEKSFTDTEKKLESCSNEILQKDASLIEHQKLLQQTLENDKLKNEFYGNISHEFRTPLNILLSNIQLMNHYIKLGEIKSDTRDINKYMGIMKHNCFRLLKLINNIIDITKIDAGYMQPIFENNDIVKEIENIVLSVSEYAESKGLSLHIYSNNESFITAYDPEKLERIMLNLLSNAVKFTKSGGSICVNTICSPSQISISVSDTGIGIPEDKLSSIFQRFNQVDKSLTKSYDGSGIGLSLVQSLVEMQGGSITVNSILSKGSEFIVLLPARLVEENEKNIKTTAISNNICTEKINIEFSDIPK